MAPTARGLVSNHRAILGNVRGEESLGTEQDQPLPQPLSESSERGLIKRPDLWDHALSLESCKEFGSRHWLPGQPAL